ncbi:MAG TPA: hypothetical protein VII13_16510 [Vicinamibacteria bacterium]|jgi:hypothetical protein
MTCDEVEDWLDEAGEAAPPDDVGRHLEGCAGCREALALQRALLARVAALPEEMEPSRDLWPEIARRARGSGSPARRSGFALSWTSGLAAAAALAAASSALTAIALRSRPAPAGAPAPVARPVAAGATDDLRRSEEEYLRAAATLMTALEGQRAGLPPETVAAVEQNLQAIDRALGDIRAALAQDPSSTRLAHMLVSTHRKKLDLLEQVVRLSTKA